MQLLKSKVLSKAQEDEEQDVPEYGVGDEDLEGLTTHGDEAPADDEASKWLQDNEPKKRYSSQWKPNEKAYTPDVKARMQEHKDKGLSDREAEFHAGAHGGSKDYESAKHSRIDPSVSLAGLDMIEQHGLDYFNKRGEQDVISGGETGKPMKHADLAMKQAHEKATGDYSKAYNDFLSSDDTKGLKGRDRLQAIQGWKDNWKKQNPEHESNLMEASKAQESHGKAMGAIKTKSAEAMQHLTGAGGSGESSMSAGEMAQHFGGADESGAATGGSITQDPVASFAAKNPKILQHLNDDQKRRMQHVDAAAATKGIVRVRKNPKVG